MNAVKLSGYGVKVTADDPDLNVRFLLENFTEVNPCFTCHVQNFLDKGDDSFTALASAFKALVETNSPWMEFVYLDGPVPFQAFAIVARDDAMEITDGVNPVREFTTLGWSDTMMMQRWTRDLIPGYKTEWLFENIDPDFVGTWKKTDDDEDDDD